MFRAEADSPREPAMEPQRIVYAGDDECLCWALEGQLEPRGYAIERFADATALAEDPAADWHRILILDADLTTRAGLGFFESVRARDPGIPVILITEKKTLAHVGLARLEGAEAIFFKPLTDFGPLLETIERAFARLDRWDQVLHAYALQG
jgi:DNA-binding NtrC family response regulator